MPSSASPRYLLNVVYSEQDAQWVHGYLLPELGLKEGQVIHPEHFKVGLPVVEELARAVTESQFTAVVWSKTLAADGARQFAAGLAEHASLIARERRLLPLVLDPLGLPAQWEGLTWLDFTTMERWAEGVSRLRESLQVEAAAPVQEELECPYPGLRPYTAREESDFVGREAKLEELARKLGAHACVVLIGASGSGKSSLVQAGLLPRLASGRYFSKGHWAVRQFRPGSRPLVRLEQALGGDSSLPETVSDVLRKEGAEKLLLVIDQFEELFSLNAKTPEVQREFIQRVKALGRQGSGCVALLLVRADFYPELLTHHLLSADSGERVELKPPEAPELREIIEEPARRKGVHLERGLVECLVGDAADEPGVLPFLQETLVWLWRQRMRRFIPLSVYLALGEQGRVRLAQAMSDKAEATLAELGKQAPARKALARRVLLRLVQFGEGRADLRRQQRESALRARGDDLADFEEVLGQLRDSRLLTVSGVETDDERRVDLSHESLITGWPRLQEWLRDKRTAEQTRRRLEDKAAEWVRLGRGMGGLLDAVELREAAQWLAGPDASVVGVSEQLEALVQASREAQERELTQAKVLAAERKLIGRIRGSLLVILLLVGIAASWVWYQAQTRSKEESSRALATLAQHHLAEKPQLAALLAAEASALANTVEARKSLMAFMDRYPGLLAVLDESPRRWTSTAFSPDGRWLAAQDDKGGVQLWEVGTWKRRQLALEVPHETKAGGGLLSDKRLSFSPAGAWLAAIVGGHVIVWSVETGRLVHSLPETKASSVLFLDDKELLFINREGSRAVRWNVPGGRVDAEFEVSGTSLAYDPKSKRLAIGRMGKPWTVSLWKLESSGQTLEKQWSMQELRSLFPYTLPDAHFEFLWELAFIQEGRGLALLNPEQLLLVSLEEDGRTRSWVWSQEVSGGLGRTGGRAASLASSPEGSYVVVGEQGGNVFGWYLGPDAFHAETLKRERRGPLWVVPKVQDVLSLSFSPDGRSLVSASSSDYNLLMGPGTNTLAVWRVEAEEPRLEVGGRVKDLAFSQNGETLAAAVHTRADEDLLWEEEDFTGQVLGSGVKLWSLGDPLKPVPLPVQVPRCLANSVALDQEGQHVAWSCLAPRMGGDAHIAALKGLKAGEVLATVDGGISVAYSPKESVFGIGGVDGLSLIDAPGVKRQDLQAPGAIWDLHFSPESNGLAWRGSQAWLWDICAWKQELSCLFRTAPDKENLTAQESLASEDVPRSVTLSRNWVAWSTRRALFLKHRSDKATPRVLEGFASDILMLSPSETFLATGRLMAPVMLWDVATGLLMRESGFWLPRGATALEFSPDGSWLAIGTPDFIHLKDMRLETWRARACRVVDHDVTSKEWQALFPDRPYPEVCGVPPQAP
jgi:WD40 repeat protein/energy-coupling factor transporter ATP-binding protein EcfA2